MRLLVSILLLLCSTLSAGAAAEGFWTLSIERLVIEEPTRDSVVHKPDGSSLPGKREERRERLQAFLGAEWILLRGEDVVTLYDFSTRRTHVVDNSGRTEHSLFADAGGRHAEIANRRYLAGILGKLGGEVHVNLAEDETEVGVEADPPAGATFQFSTDEKATVVRAGDAEIARWQLAEEPVPQAVRRSLQRMVMRLAPLHPRVRTALFDEARPPASLTAHVRGIGARRTVVLTLTALGLADTDPRPALLGAPLRPIEGDDPPAVAARLLARQLGAVPSVESYRMRGDQAFEAGHVLDAFLLEIEGILATGHQDSDRVKRIVGKGDPEVDRLRKVLSDNSEESLKVMESLHPADARNEAMLLIFRANTLLALKKPDQAADLFARALAKNPFHAGALHDFGDFLYATYHAEEAWDCWDAAKLLAPDLSMLSNVKSLEALLLKSYPDWF